MMFAAGIPFGLSKLSAARSGMYIAPGGEFAFVVLGEAARLGLLESTEMRAIFFMVVLSMALTPYLAVRLFITPALHRWAAMLLVLSVFLGSAPTIQRDCPSMPPRTAC